MINSLIKWSINNRIAIVLLSLLLLGIGAYITPKMPVDVFPDLTAPTATIIVEGHGMAPEEMETQVTFPIETAVNGSMNVRRVRSATAIGIAVIWVEFEWGTDIYKARQIISEKLISVRGSLPPEVEPPVLAPVSSVMGEVVFASLTSSKHSLMDLRTIATTEVKRRILSVPGVSQVTPIGGDQKQYQIVINTNILNSYNLSVENVREALAKGNENVSAGFILEGGQENLVQGVGRIKTVKDIEEIVVEVRNNIPIRISDLAIVQIGPAIKRGTGSASRRDKDWKPIIESGVIVAIQKQPGVNTLSLTKELDKTLDELQSTLPEGMVLNKNLFRQANFIQASVDNTVSALVEGSVMVVIVVLLFLVSFRPSIITLLAIPLSLVVTILTLRFLDFSINTMTLGGMAIAIGSLVDDAIIDVENVLRRLKENSLKPVESRRSIITVIYEASVEIRSSIVFATVIIILVFCPLFFLSGIEGRLLQPLGLAFIISLAASLVVALTLTPALCYFLLGKTSVKNNEQDAKLVRFLKAIYSKPLKFAMKFPIPLSLVTLCLLVVAVIGLSKAGRNFLPPFNEGALVVGLVTKPGTSLQQSDALAHQVETILMKHPEIEAIGRRTGRAEEDEHVLGVEASEIDLTLDMDAPKRLGLPERSMPELLEALRNDLHAVPGVNVTFGQPIGHRIDHMLSGTRANIAIKIFGPDLIELRKISKEVENLMKDITGVVDLSAEQQIDVPMQRVHFKRDVIARYGLSIEQLASSLKSSYQGEEVGVILEGKTAFDVVVKVTSNSESPLKVTDNIMIDTPSGAKIALSELAYIDDDTGPNLISRENVQRKIVVMCNVSERDLNSVVTDIKDVLNKNLELPRSYYIEYGGQFESAEATTRNLTIMGAVVILTIAFLLYFAFKSIRCAVLIMINLPFALIGGVVGVFLSGGVISVASIIGFISVFGIATRNGIMMISHYRHLQVEEGLKDFYQAIYQGSMERLSPILMTAFASGIALIPLALKSGEPGTEILSPMATIILWGLLSATFLNMFLIPALYFRFGKSTTAELEEA